MSDFKKTLLMPATEFEMKANLFQKEPKLQQQWRDDDLEKQILKKIKIKKNS